MLDKVFEMTSTNNQIRSKLGEKNYQYFSKLFLWIANADQVSNAKFSPYACDLFLNALVIS